MTGHAGLVELGCLAMAGHYPEILISGQRLDGPEGLRLRTSRGTRAAGQGMQLITSRADALNSLGPSADQALIK